MQYTPQDIDDTPTNALCWSCHNNSIAPYEDTHSSIQTDAGYGPWTIECWLCHDQHQQTQNHLYGTTYGKLIRTPIRLENIIGVSKTGSKTVRFTGNTGFVQGSPNRNGICEVCHTQTLHFRNDASLASQGTHAGYKGLTCTLCHKHNKGFVGSGDHSVFITDDNQTGNLTIKCSNCHTGYATTPESAHHACSDCHTTPPTLVDSTFPNAVSQPDWDGAIGTMFQNLTDAASAPYTQYIYPGAGGRLQDDGGLFINDVGFKKIRCGECHAAKPDALAAATHGSHPSSDWDYSLITNDCVGCHSDGGLGTIKGVHNDTCALCHVDPSTGNYARKLGPGGDGDARLAPNRTGDCLLCHPGSTYPKPSIHHDTVNATATPTSNCTTACHNTTTGHAGNHDALVAIQSPPCQGCHGATPAFGGDNVPVDATPGNLVHDYCTSCHVNPSNNLIETVTTPTAHATTMNNPDGTTATNNGGGTCTACHTTYFNGHSHAHTFGATPACATCHGNPSPALTNALDAVSAPFVGAGEVHSTLGCATCHNVTTDGSLKGSAVGHALATGCVDCHIGGSNTWSSIHTAALGTGPGKVDHTNRIYVAAACATCHGNPTPSTSNARDAATTPFTAAGEVHSGSGCVTCHTGGNDGALKTGPFTKVDIIAKGDCTTCHANTSTWTTIHMNAAANGAKTGVDHTGRVNELAFCITCHTATAGGAGGVMPVNSAATRTGDMVHDSCSVCHQATGILQTGNTSYGNQPIAKGTCGTCHTAAYFDSHVHGTATGYISHVVSYQVNGLDGNTGTTADNDTSQPTPQGCANCHNGNNADSNGMPLDSWADILSEHVTGCARCHSYTDDGQGTPTEALVTAAIGSRTPASCDTCHEPKTPNVKHGSHTSTDFGWTSTTKSTCGTASCHDWPNNQDVVVDIHNGTCTNCHATSSGGDGTTVAKDVGDATKGSITPPHSDACTVCHTLAKNRTHHDRSNSYAANGTCTQCHTDPRVARGYRQIMQMSCRACHVRVNGTTLEIVSITIGKEGGSGTGVDTGNTYTAITAANGFAADHTFNNTNATDETDAITNYGICFECHGATGRTGYAAATKPLPYHALPKPGAYDAVNNTIGGDGWQSNIGTGSASGSHFRGNQNWNAVSNNSFFPIGKGRMNVGYAQHSLPKGSTNMQPYKAPNNSAGATYQSFVTGLTFGKQIVEHNGSAVAYVPNFDATCTGCDTVSITGFNSNTNKGKVVGWNVTATSSSGATLHLIWGGVDFGTFASGSTFTVIYRDDGNQAFDQYFCFDQFNSFNDSQYAVVSEDGGAAISPAGWLAPRRVPRTSESPSGSCSYK